MAEETGEWTREDDVLLTQIANRMAAIRDGSGEGKVSVACHYEERRPDKNGNLTVDLSDGTQFVVSLSKFGDDGPSP